jgi:hypothetical protein
MLGSGYALSCSIGTVVGTTSAPRLPGILLLVNLRCGKDQGLRVDIQVRVMRRRRWSGEVKGRIAAESYAPGAIVSDAARRHGISAQHLFA